MGKLNLAFVGIAALAIIVAGFVLISEEDKGDTYLSFSIESDLPDPSVYLKLSENESRGFTYPMQVDKPHYIVFSITSNEKEKTSYVYRVTSPLFNKTEEIALNPKETKKISLTITPTESQKWSTRTIAEFKNGSAIDITKYSWIASKKDLQILIREDGLPLLVEENYNLPISSSVGEYDEILHTNLSLEDLRKRPFTKKYVSERKGATYQSMSVLEMGLQIEGDKLSSYINKTETSRESKKQTFMIYLKKLGETEVDPETGREFHKETYFNYQIV